ncbi:MAG: MATE family efflux transporter [Muribaculaceae bacterium]|nr:MATE family efflux transporter [Muribaculaceae bacterium]
MADTSSNTPITLGTESIGKLLIQYSVPAIIASVATSLYNIIDSIFIGQGVGPLAISGLAITFPLMNLVIAFCMFIAAGGAAISSIYLGQKDYRRATNVLSNVVKLSFIHSIVFGGLSLLFLDEILYFFGATDSTIEYAREFMRIILYGTPISYIFIVLNNLMRATGYPKKAMILALLSVLVNIILAPIFIFVLNWGIGGAALATICGQAISLVWHIIHFRENSSFVHFDKNHNKFSWSIIKNVYSIGLSPFLMNVCACIVVIFINKALLETGGNDGELAVGAYGIVNRVGMLFVMIVFGITQGMQPILGYNYGANNWGRVKRTLNIGFIVGLLVTTLGFIVGELIPQQIASLFANDDTLIDISTTGFRISFMFFAVIGGQIVIQNFFQSIGKPMISIFLSLTRQLLFLIPTLLIFPRIWGVEGVWTSLAVSDILAFIVATITLVIIMRRKNKNLIQQL